MSFELEDPGNTTTENLNETQQGLNETVNQTVNETVQNGTSQTPLEFWSFLGDPFILAIVVIGGIGIIGFSIGIWYYKNKAQSDPIFEKESLEELIKPSMVKLLDYGKPNNSIMRRDLRTVGKIHKDYRIAEKHELLNEDSNKQDIDVINKDHEDFEEIIEDLETQGVFSDNQLEKLKESEIVPHRFIMVKPTNTLKKTMWIISDAIFGLDKYTEYYLVPENGIVDNGADESISVDRNLQFRPFAGMNIPLTYSSMGIISSAVFRHLYEISLEDQANYHKQVNKYSSQFSQKLQELEKKIELEQEAKNSGTLGKMNNS